MTFPRHIQVTSRAGSICALARSHNGCIRMCLISHVKSHKVSGKRHIDMSHIRSHASQVLIYSALLIGNPQSEADLTPNANPQT